MTISMKDFEIILVINKSIVAHIFQRFRWLKFPSLYFSPIVSLYFLGLFKRNRCVLLLFCCVESSTEAEYTQEELYAKKVKISGFFNLILLKHAFI